MGSPISDITKRQVQCKSFVKFLLLKLRVSFFSTFHSYWICTLNNRLKCKQRVIIDKDKEYNIKMKGNGHNHLIEQYSLLKNNLTKTEDRGVSMLLKPEDDVYEIN